ncbi:MAG: hypothetical protein ACRC1J_10395 [Sandaracinobacteroides sp.]
MTFALVSVLASLCLVLALNWKRFEAIGWGNVIRMILIWGAIITGLVLVMRLLGY